MLELLGTLLELLDTLLELLFSTLLELLGALLELLFSTLLELLGTLLELLFSTLLELLCVGELILEELLWLLGLDEEDSLVLEELFCSSDGSGSTSGAQEKSKAAQSSAIRA